MIESIGYVFTIFGGIFLLIAGIAYVFMKKQTTKPDCPEDVSNVSRNKKWAKYMFIVNSIAVAIGICCLIYSAA